MNRTSPERCRVCTAPAVVRMDGVSLCARCGLERSSGGTSRITRRAALLGLLSSGFLAKLLLGAVAVTAVGGVAATMPRSDPPAPVEAVATTQGFLSTDVPVSQEAIAVAEEAMLAADTLVESVRTYAGAVQKWGDCVSEAARGNSGESFDPKVACGDMPAAAEHGLPDLPLPALTNAQDKAADKATATDDRTADKATKTEDHPADKATKTEDHPADKADLDE